MIKRNRTNYTKSSNPQILKSSSILQPFKKPTRRTSDPSQNQSSKKFKYPPSTFPPPRPVNTPPT